MLKWRDQVGSYNEQEMVVAWIRAVAVSVAWSVFIPDPLIKLLTVQLGKKFWKTLKIFYETEERKLLGAKWC